MIPTIAVTILTFAAPRPLAHVAGSVAVSGRTVENAVVYLQGKAKSTPLKNAVIDQRDKTFIPRVLVVTVGTTVTFPNNDSVFHNVFAHYQAKRFDLGMYPKGAKKTQKFDKPGLVALLCSVHSQMSAYIMVVDTPYFAVTDRKGGFEIPNVEPGDYTMNVWHESGAEQSKTMRVEHGMARLAVQIHRR